MENPIRTLLEKNQITKLQPELQGADFSLFVADIDRVWQSGEIVEDNHNLLVQLSEVSEIDAAEIILSYIAPLYRLPLVDRLAAMGVSVGVMTDNGSIPRGVHGAIRSDYPILLMSHSEPKQFHRPIEIASALAAMIYGKNTESAIKFLKHFNISSLEKSTSSCSLE